MPLPPRPAHADYRPPPFLVESVHLDFVLGETTRVTSTLKLTPNYEGAAPPPLKLDGRKDVTLVSVKVGARSHNSRF